LVPFDETGINGNIALFGSNGITASSITSNAISGSIHSPFTALFDGWQDFVQKNASSVGRIRNGNFGSVWNTADNSYFSIDLGKEASISGFRVLSYNHSRVGLYFPKDIRIESSVDGVNFSTEELFTLPEVIDTEVISMSTPFTSRYFRFHVVNGYHDHMIVFGEVEVFQTQ
jgi:hypothetical protein